MSSQAAAAAIIKTLRESHRDLLAPGGVPPPAPNLQRGLSDSAPPPGMGAGGGYGGAFGLGQVREICNGSAKYATVVVFLVKRTVSKACRYTAYIYTKKSQYHVRYQ